MSVSSKGNKPVRYYFWSYMKSLFYYELHHLIMISSLHYISSSFTVLSFLKPEGLDFLTFTYLSGVAPKDRTKRARG